MNKQHNEAQIHVRSTSGKYRPGTTQPPTKAESRKLSSREQTYLGKGSAPGVSAEPEVSAIWPAGPGLDAVDIVEVLSGSMHTDEGDSVDPSSQG